MTAFMQYTYVFLWAALAVLMFFVGRKYGLYGYLLSIFFAVLTIWYGLRAFGGLPVFEGVPGYIFRGMLIVFLIVIIYIWWRSRKSSTQKKNEETAACSAYRLVFILWHNI